MADFNALEALINAYIKQNGVKAITGNILNGVLRGMVSALGKGWTIADGDATPTTDPGTMTGPVAYIAHTAGTYEHFGNLVVNDGEVALLKYNEQTWTKEVIASLAATASIDGNVGTPAVNVTFQNGVLAFDFRNMKGNTGDAAGFGTVNATVDANIGTPGVSVQTSGPDTAKNITFAFTNLKGETGVTSVVATVDNTVGTPQCAVSLVGQELHLDFTGLKGPQGDTGSSVDYPFTIVNNLTTNDATQALSAAMGVQLESEISQLDLKVGEISGQFYGVFASASALPSGITVKGYAYVGSEEPFELYIFDGTSWTDTESTVSGVHFIDNELSIGTVVEGDTADAQLTGDAPNQILDLTIPRAGNPFKGLFPDFASLKASGNATDGDYAYVQDPSPATTASIYRYDSTASSDKYWADSGIDTDFGSPIVVPFTEYAKNTILYVMSKVAWINQNGQDYLDLLHDALLLKNVVSIEATFTQGTDVFGTNSNLGELKADLVVVATYDDASTRELESHEYELSGTLTHGTSTITVTYQGKTDTFTVSIVNYVLFKNNFIIASLATQYGNNEEYHYTSGSVASRCCYPYFDILVENGKTYKIKCEFSGTPVANAAVIFYDSTALAAVASHTTIQNANTSDSGWQTLTNGEFQLTAPFDGAARINSRKDSSNTNFTEVPFTRVIIDEQ